MAKVTDPALIAALEAKAAQKVTDPDLIAALEAKASGVTPMDPTAPLPRDTVSALGANLDINRESTAPPWWTQVDQQSLANRLPFAAAQASFFGAGGDQIPQMEAPAGRSQQMIDALGAGIGTGADFALMAPLAAEAIPARLGAAAARGLQAARVPAAVATRVAPGLTRAPAMFAGHTALSGGSPGEVALSGAEGLAFGALGAVPGLRTVMQGPVGHELVNTEALALLNMAHGMDLGEAHATAIPTALGLKLGGMAAGPQGGLGPERVGSWDAVREMRFRREVAMRELQAREMAAEQARAEARAREMTEQPPLVEPQPFWRSPVETGSMDPADVARRVREAAAEDRARREAVQPPEEALAESGQGGLMPAGTTMPVRNPPAVLPPEGRLAAEAPSGPPVGLSPEVVRRAVQGSDLPAEPNLALPPGGSTGAPSATPTESSPILTSGGRRQYVSPIKGENGEPLYTEDIPTVPRRASAREPFGRGEPVTGTIEVGPDGQAILPQQQLTPRRGRQPLPTRRGDVTAGSILGGGGEAFKFRELRQALGDLGRNLVDADARIADKIAPFYRDGMTDSEFLGQREVREQMMRAENMGSVLDAAKAIASGLPPAPKPPGPSGAPTRRPEPTSGQTEGVAGLRESVSQTRRGSRLSEGVNEFLNDGESFRDMTGRLKDAGPVVDPARLKEIRNEVRAERAAAKAAAKEAGEEAPKYSRDSKDEADYRALKENLDPKFVQYVEAEAAKKAGEDGGKSPLDIGYFRAQRHSQDYLYQGAGGGAAGDANPLDGPLIRNVQDSRRVGYKWHDATLAEAEGVLKRNGIKMDSPEDAAVAKLIEGAKGGSIADFAQTPDGQAILSGVKGRDGTVRAAEEVAQLLENVRVDRNSLTNVYGETELSKREGYAPKYDARPAWWNIFGKEGKIARAYRGPEAGPTAAPSLDAPGKAKKSDPHARRRTRGDEGRDWSIVRGLHRYIGEEAAVISGTMGLHNNYQYARFLELNGFEGAAKVVRAYSQSDFNKRGWGLGGQLDRAFNEGGVTGVLGAGMKWNYDRLADAVFTLNLGWNMIVQPSSAVFVYAAGGNKASAQGLIGARDPEFRKFVDQNVFARQVKSRRGGSVGDIGQDASAEGSIDTGITKLKHKAQTFNQIIEREIDMYAAYVGMKQGEAMGLKGRELVDFMSDSIKKTQDVYNRQDRPELVRSKMFNVFAPFSGFGFNMASNLQEQGAIPFASRTGTYQVRGNRGQRVGYAVRLGVAAAVANTIAGMVAGREELYGPSSLPMFDILTGSGFGKGQLGPALVYQNDVKVWKAARDGEYGDAVARALKQRVPAARVFANIIQASDFASGNGPFVLPEDEMIQAITLGVWSTPSGRAYIDKMKGKGGKSAEIPSASPYPVVAPAGPAGGGFPTVGRGGVPIPAGR